MYRLARASITSNLLRWPQQHRCFSITAASLSPIRPKGASPAERLRNKILAAPKAAAAKAREVSKDRKRPHPSMLPAARKGRSGAAKSERSGRFERKDRPARTYAKDGKEGGSDREGARERRSFDKAFSRDGDRPRRTFDEGSSRDRPRAPKKFAVTRDSTVLTDSYFLSERVQRLLKNGREQDAINLIRMATNETSCTVSWNLILQECLKKGAVTAAFKYFNEMKKRAHHPDSYTYTILFNGLAENAHVSSVPEYLSKLWFSLTAPKSPVRLNTIHANAALKVAVKANNLTMAWEILDKLPTEGAAKPDALTYTSLFTLVANKDGEDKMKEIEELKGVWEQMFSAWKAGDEEAEMSETFIAAYCRMLTSGGKKDDCEEVFKVFEQTFGIKNLNRTATAVVEQPRKLVKIGNNGLSVILETCSQIGQKRLGINYFDLIRDHGVKPDLVNYHALFRLYVQSRAAEDADAVLAGMRREGVRPDKKILFLALQACRRDGTERGFEIATNIMNRCPSWNIFPDAQLYLTYLKCADVTKSPKSLATAVIKAQDMDLRGMATNGKREGDKARMGEALRVNISLVDQLLFAAKQEENPVDLASLNLSEEKLTQMKSALMKTETLLPESKKPKEFVAVADTEMDLDGAVTPTVPTEDVTAGPSETLKNKPAHALKPWEREKLRLQEKAERLKEKIRMQQEIAELKKKSHELKDQSREVQRRRQPGGYVQDSMRWNKAGVDFRDAREGGKPWENRDRRDGGERRNYRDRRDDGGRRNGWEQRSSQDRDNRRPRRERPEKQESGESED
ncbi:hypothetical protein SAICODRAFT_70578 [Saitoella complicata NRRL Y-17804]|uniref:uncharacterized protein n=1 Tax=Saitoella complicata (strain BCRC 22490 / CBS 7301 / JCM 7358 / NBRC 10748 / NRRL Y-17804) TaxID=698492 RepID=UPI0008679577|nr:uncharacterized protein SAICODRAFT_70578 [Saitoella complicata NRRL Y-17804]ODQ53881.1 hypothetical protein SAICODRAFT_70578 [Saitoella complicata NRRL Y-17804]